MQKKFSPDTFGTTIAIGVIFAGWLLMIVPLLIDRKYVELLAWLAALLLVHFFAWLALARGTYILIDTSQKMLYTSRFAIKKSFPLDAIVHVREKATFGGTLTEVQIWYVDKKGNKKMTRTMSKQAFQNETAYKSFLQTLYQVNPNIDIPSNK